MKPNRGVIISSVVTLTILLMVFLLPHPTQATSATWYVATTGGDSNDCLTIATPCASINGTLHKSTFAANDTILVAEGIYTETGNAVATITTSVQLLGGWNADFSAQTDLSIIDGESQRRGLEITNATVMLDHFGVQHGTALPAGTGGGILTSNSTVTITESIIRQNVSSFTGAGVYQIGGVLNVRNSALLDNTAGNNVSGDGGALYQNGGVANINNTTVTRNYAGFGGGAFGLINYAVLNLNSTTVVSNVTPGQGGAITIDYLQGVVHLQNSILAGNQGGPTTPECTGPVHSLGYNLVGDTNGCDFTSGVGDRLNLAPQLSVLTGTIPYYDLSYTNPAVNKGNPAGCRDALGNILSYDQRGLPRVGRCDIGAVEFQQEIHTATWYVATTGNDANDCLTASTPCATLTGVLQKPTYIGDTILVASGLYTSTSNVIGLITTDVRLLGGWNNDFTVQSDLSTIDGEGARRGLEIANSAVILDRFVIQHGYALNLENGGGILMSGSNVTITQSVIQENVSNRNGGGIYQLGGTLTVYDSTFLENIASDNVTGDGGALYQDGGVANFNNSTVTQNQAEFGGGAFGLISYAVLNLNSTTVVSNVTPGQGGAITIDYLQGVVHLQNTILANNTAAYSGPECTGPVQSSGYNVIGDTSGCNFISGPGDQLNANPHLSVLTGTIPFYDLSYQSPAVNHGNPDGCQDIFGKPLAYDQRGLPRVGRCDIGAVEFQQEIHTTYLPTILNNYCSDFYDDFSDPLSGWPVENNAFFESRYLNGEYSIYTKNGDYLYLLNSPSCPRENYTVETDVRWVGSSGDGYGVVFGVTDAFSQYYLFYVSADYGEYALLRRDASGFHFLANFTNSPAIHRDRFPNHLKVRREGSAITLEVNGTYLGIWYDGTITDSTQAGVFSNPYSNPPQSDARFDNFSTKAINPSDLSNRLSSESESGTLDNRPSFADHRPDGKQFLHRNQDLSNVNSGQNTP